MTMTLYDFLMLEKSDYDTYDTVFDVEVTACTPYGSTNNDKEFEYYYKFCDFIMKHVEFVEKTGECSCVVNWYKFINDNIEVFREAANDMWKPEWELRYGKPDNEDLIYEWINEIHSWLAGYVGESEYREFMEDYADRIKEVAV